MIQAETKVLKEKQAMTAQLSRPSYRGAAKDQLQQGYMTELRMVSTIPNSCLDADTGCTADDKSGKQRFEEAPAQIHLYDNEHIKGKGVAEHIPIAMNRPFAGD
jgi:hypothetical protein